MAQAPPSSSSHLWQILRYAIVGGFNTLFYMAILYFLLAVLHLHDEVAATIAFLWSIAFYYGAHRCFTFRSNASMLGEIKRLIPATATNYLISVGLVALLSQGLSLHAGAVAVLAGTMTAATGYFLASFWIFAAPRRKR